MSLGSLESVQALGAKWCSFWSEGDVKSWVAMYTQEATFLDHGMQIKRQGRANVEDHFNIWKRAVPDATAVCEGAWPGERLPSGKWRIMIRLRWTGTFSNDLPTIKASGTKINYPVRAEMIVQDDGLIEEAAEWYSTHFWEVKPVSEYNRRGDLTSTA